MSSVSNTRLNNFKVGCKLGEEIFIERDAEYGNSTASTGVLGAVVEIIGGASKLRELVLKSPTYGKDKRSKVLNALIDVHNYANIAIMEMEKENWNGSDYECNKSSKS